ncbi:hypothetical protein A1O1_08206 [Capronia coronata CBS 617.96]|uniref:Protein MON2 homolog n=1 Tax=Capronia coronata CBS 617.96 TaxID=1182541 RepID=W9XNK7_9EURO|nr:uncharacterized protein A1O1_08206 [Capronia coronata CBS 617.96]EXJ82137.1 hypothetical protein A1O1_08206 [Capronia coronata CBS 617.96]
MTQAFLQSELTSLISDSKRRHNDVRTAAEQSLADLKAITVTSEAQLAGDLLRRPQFIDPFILACKSKNVKLASIGTICLQRMTASTAVARTRLPDVLDAFRDGVASGYEAQLKVLQTLPSLLQFYASDLHGELLARTLEICAVLQSSRTAIVSNTAAATFQQLVSTVFEQASRPGNPPNSTDDETDAAEQSEPSVEIATKDANRLFYDFCMLLDQQRPVVLKIENVPPGFMLETIQILLSTHKSFLTAHAEQHPDCWEHLMNGLSRVLVRKDAFGMVVRAWAILPWLLQGYAQLLKDSLTQMIPIILSALDKEGNPAWRRALCLEFFQKVCSNFSVLRNTFELFDGTKESPKLVGQMMSAFVRIAAEDPSLIGLGRQSTVPVQRANEIRSEDVASIEAQGLGGAITSVSAGESNITGISMEWSVLDVPLMEQPDKPGPPAIPGTYIYALVLNCISAFCDGMSKFVMPLSVPSRPTQRHSQDSAQRDSTAPDPTDEDIARKPNRSTTSVAKYQRLINPLTLADHPQSLQIRTCAAMIEACWPAALATCSTFLNAALDSEFYHLLVRSVQKLAQVSGVLELPTPRDALLTTLAKASIPANANGVISAYQNSTTSRAIDLEADSTEEDLRSPSEPPQSPTSQTALSPLNVRHLLCLRALLNLGIALGPTLDQDSWFILIETMQTVEALISLPVTLAMSSQYGGTRVGLSGNDGQTTLANEISAVQAATKRMLESTRGYTAESFAVTVRALFRLLGQAAPREIESPAEEAFAPTLSPARAGPERHIRRISRSVSGLWTKSKTLDLEVGFVLGKVSDLSRINIHRFTSTSETSCSWDLVGRRLMEISQASDIPGSHRVHAASIVDFISIEVMKMLDDPDNGVEEADTIRSRCLQALSDQLDFLYGEQSNIHGSIELEIHKICLEALESMLSHSGETLGNGWPMVFKILSMTFVKRDGREPVGDVSADQTESPEEKAQILRVAFRSVQLIASDFLSVLNPRSFVRLARLLQDFGSQPYDLNVALTSTTLLWSLASQVLAQVEKIDLTFMPSLDMVPQHLDLRREPPGPSILWSVILVELVELCKDGRSDIRNAAIKILLKLLEASGDSLSSKAWSMTLIAGPLNVVRACVKDFTLIDNAQSEWLASATELTDGVIRLVTENLNVMVEYEDFTKTWLVILDVFKDLLDTLSLTASSLVFVNLSKLLSSLAAAGKGDPDFLLPAMRLWAQYHPADIRPSAGPGVRTEEESPNQTAFTAYLRTIIEAHRASPAAVMSFQFDHLGMASILMKATERAVIFSTHPPYTSDVKSLAPEQKEALECLTILKDLLSGGVAEYTRFLLQLLRHILGIQDGHVNYRLKKPALTKAIQKPTFIAFASACLDGLRGLIHEHAKSENFIEVLAVEESLHVLGAIIDTKYTVIPTNRQAPLWRNATVTAVAMLEALRTHVERHSTTAGELARLDSLGKYIILTVARILGCGGLSKPPAKQTEETLLQDEAFDIDHFQVAHAAVVPIFQDDEISEETCRLYVITLFKASLLTEPWFGDMPDDLAHEPLKALIEVRPGSVRQPTFGVRREICYTALDALFDLVRLPPPASSKSEVASGSGHKLAYTASPYLCLRVVHPLKVFLADQRLRGLTPPPMPQQIELQAVLFKFVELRSDNEAFERLIGSARKSGHVQSDDMGRTSSFLKDGKEHLRVLYPFILRVQRFWRELPRLKSEGAWQADEPGRGIDDTLERWNLVLAEDWDFY